MVIFISLNSIKKETLLMNKRIKEMLWSVCLILMALLENKGFSTIKVFILIFFTIPSFSQSWKRNFGGEFNDSYTSVIPVFNGIVAVGYSDVGSFGSGDWSDVTGKGETDAIIVKYDLNGNIVWKRNFGGSGNDSFESVISVPDGFVAAGFSYASSFGNGD